MDKHFKVSSSSKLKLGENVALRLMESLTPSAGFGIFMDNYFTSSCLLTRHSVSNMQATRVLNKNSLRKCTIIGDKQLQKKKNLNALNSTHQAEKQCNFDSGLFERQQCGLRSFF